MGDSGSPIICDESEAGSGNSDYRLHGTIIGSNRGFDSPCIATPETRLTYFTKIGKAQPIINEFTGYTEKSH